MFTYEQKKFIKYVSEISLCGLVTLALYVFVIVFSVNTESYSAGLKQKFSLLTSTPSPRLVLVGGSSLAIGVNSNIIKSETNFNPINMGTFAALGIRFMFVSIDEYLQSGDTILFIPEHQVLQQPPYGSGHFLLETIHVNPYLISDVLTYHSLTTIVHHLPQWFQGRIKSIYARKIEPLFYERELSLSDVLYNVYNFNSYGDVISESAGDQHLTKKEVLESESGYVGTGGINSETIRFLSKRIEMLEQRGVHVLVSWPAMAQSIYDANPDLVKDRIDDLENALGQEHVIGSVEDFLVSDDVFVDASSHLTSTGRDEYTRRLISLLIPYLQAQ